MDNDALYDITIAALAKRDYSVSKITLFLRSYCDDKDKVDQIIARLSESNYLNDRRLIENEINKYFLKKYGQSRIRQELKRKGFNDDIISQQFEQREVDWLDMLRDLKQKKFGSAKPVDAKEKAKQIRYLQYKGHALSDILSVLG